MCSGHQPGIPMGERGSCSLVLLMFVLVIVLEGLYACRLMLALVATRRFLPLGTRVDSEY